MCQTNLRTHLSPPAAFELWTAVSREKPDIVPPSETRQTPAWPWFYGHLRAMWCHRIRNWHQKFKNSNVWVAKVPFLCLRTVWWDMPQNRASQCTCKPMRRPGGLRSTASCTHLTYPRPRSTLTHRTVRSSPGPSAVHERERRMLRVPVVGSREFRQALQPDTHRG